jgi:hypothetical protein
MAKWLNSIYAKIRSVYAETDWIRAEIKSTVLRLDALRMWYDD